MHAPILSTGLTYLSTQEYTLIPYKEHYKQLITSCVYKATIEVASLRLSTIG